MRKAERYAHIVGWFTENMPVAETELHFQSTFQLLVAVVLSAQCTDKRVNMVTPGLFKRFPTPEAMAEASFDELFGYIRSVSYPNSKTRHLIAMFIDDFDIMTNRKRSGVSLKVIWIDEIAHHDGVFHHANVAVLVDNERIAGE